MWEDIFILLLTIGIVIVILTTIVWTISNLMNQTTVVGAIQWGAILIFLGLGGNTANNKK